VASNMAVMQTGTIEDASALYASENQIHGEGGLSQVLRTTLISRGSARDTVERLI
jgi:hypothetical protein